MATVKQPSPYLPGLSNRQRIDMFGTPASIRSVNVADDIPQTPVLSDGRRQAVKCHPDLVDHFVDTCDEAHRRSHYRPRRMDSHVIRLIRGSSSVYSSHSWATAWDIFSTPADVAPPGGVWTPDAHFTSGSGAFPAAASIERNFADFVEVFLEAGFWWGGFFRRKTRPRGQSRGPHGMDTPHFEWRSKLPMGSASTVASARPGEWGVGSTGDDVAFIQTLMRERLGVDIESDGIFGPQTGSAVLAARIRLKLPPSQVADRPFVDALKAYRPVALTAAPTPTITTSAPPDESEALTKALTRIQKIAGNALK